MHKKTRMNRLIAALALASFITSPNGIPVVVAAAETPAAPAQLWLPSDLNEIRIPSNIGKKEETHQSGRRVVVLIQDAHGIPDAQRNIRNLIDFFQQTYGLSHVALEGAASRLNPQIFKSFPNAEILKKTFKEYLDQGELTGPTMAAIFNEHPAAYEGIEDWALYETGYADFLDALSRSAAVEQNLSRRDEDLRARQEKIYPAPLLEIDRGLRSFRKGDTDLLTALRLLAKIKKPEAGSELALILEEGERRPENRVPAEIEAKKIGETVTARFAALSRPSSEELKLQAAFNEKFQALKVSQLSPQEFMLFIRDLNSKMDLKLQISEDLLRLTRQQKRMRDIEGTRFFDAFENYAAAVKETLMAGEDVKQLDREERELELLKKLGSLELTRHQWEELKIRGLDRLAPAGMMDAQVAFYKNAEARDGVFAERLQKMLDSQGNGPAAVLFVAGGFHTEGLVERLKERGVSYLLLAPEITGLPREVRYKDHMRGLVSWKDYFRVEEGKVDVYKAFVRAARDRLLLKSPDQGSMLKEWRDQIIRDLSSEKQVAEAGRYTRFIDEKTGGSAADAYEKKLVGKVENFVEGLKQLQAQNQLTDQNIRQLLRPGTMTEAVMAGALDEDAPGLGSTRRVLLDAAGFAFRRLPGAPLETAAAGKSELRAQGKRYERTVVNKIAIELLWHSDLNEYIVEFPEMLVDFERVNSSYIRISPDEKLALSVFEKAKAHAAGTSDVYDLYKKTADDTRQILAEDASRYSDKARVNGVDITAAWDNAANSIKLTFPQIQVPNDRGIASPSISIPANRQTALKVMERTKMLAQLGLDAYALHVEAEKQSGRLARADRIYSEVVEKGIRIEVYWDDAAAAYAVEFPQFRSDGKAPAPLILSDDVDDARSVFARAVELAAQGLKLDQVRRQTDAFADVQVRHLGYHDHAEVNGVRINVAWDGANQLYTIHFPQVRRPGAEIVEIAPDGDIARRVFENAVALARQKLDVEQVYDRTVAYARQLYHPELRSFEETGSLLAADPAVASLAETLMEMGSRPALPDWDALLPVLQQAGALNDNQRAELRGFFGDFVRGLRNNWPLLLLLSAVLAGVAVNQVRENKIAEARQQFQAGTQAWEIFESKIFKGPVDEADFEALKKAFAKDPERLNYLANRLVYFVGGIDYQKFGADKEAGNRIIRDFLAGNLKSVPEIQEAWREWIEGDERTSAVRAELSLKGADSERARELVPDFLKEQSPYVLGTAWGRTEPSFIWMGEIHELTRRAQQRALEAAGKQAAPEIDDTYYLKLMLEITGGKNYGSKTLEEKWRAWFTGAQREAQRAAQGRNELRALDFSLDLKDVKLGFTKDRVLSLDAIEEGTIVTDIGRVNSVVAASAGLAKGILDHHQYRGLSATRLVFDNRQKLASSGKILKIMTHADPDFDAIASVVLVNFVRRFGFLPEQLKGFVDYVNYVNSWDSGQLDIKSIPQLQNTLGILVFALNKIADDEATAAALKEFGLQSFGQVFAPDFAARRGAFFGRLGEIKDVRRVELVSNFLNGLLNHMLDTGYDFDVRKGEILENDVPAELQALFRSAKEKVRKDLDDFAREMAPDRSVKLNVRLVSEVEGEDLKDLDMVASRNPESIFFDYLYTMGTLGGVIYKDNTQQLNGQPNRDYQPLEGVQGSKAVLAVSDQAGVTVRGLAAYLNERETQTRRERGLSPEPKADNRDKIFWKEALRDRLVLTTEGTVFTQEELLAALEAFQRAEAERKAELRTGLYQVRIEEANGIFVIVQKRPGLETFEMNLTVKDNAAAPWIIMDLDTTDAAAADRIFADALALAKQNMPREEIAGKMQARTDVRVTPRAELRQGNPSGLTDEARKATQLVVRVLDRGAAATGQEVEEATRSTRQVLNENAITLEQFLDSLKRSAREAAQAKELVSDANFEDALHYLVDEVLGTYLRTKFPNRAFTLALEVDSESEAANYADPLKQVRAMIERLVVKGDMGRQGKEIGQIVGPARLNPVRTLRGVKVLGDGQVVLPAVAAGKLEENLGQGFFGVELVADQEVNDPRVRTYAALLQIVLGIVAAANIRDLKEPEANRKLLQAELLGNMRLLMTYEGGGMIQLTGDGASVSLGSVARALVNWAEAREAIKSAA